MQIIIKIIRRIVILIINCLVLIISLIIPKSDRIAVVGGWFGQRFADNSKQFFLYLNENLISLGFDKVIWITRSKEIENELLNEGYKVYSAWSFLSIWYHFRAKYHLIDQAPTDINAFFSVRSKRINLWHGFPLKKVGTFMGNYKFLKKTVIQNLFDKWTSKGFWADYFILATSEFSAKILGEAFGIEHNKIIISGYPRNYITSIDNPIKYIPQFEKTFYERIEKYILKDYKIIGYFPTFRDKRRTLAFGTKDKSELNAFLDFCEGEKIKIIGKFHFAGKDDRFDDIQNHEAFINLPSDADVYTFLDQIDILITDYSSIYFDFLLWNRPIIFFAYDLEYYRDEDRGLIFNYDEFTPGPKAYNIEELQNILSQSIEVIKDRYEKDYREKADRLKMKVFNDYEIMEIKHLINQIRNNGS